MKVVNILLILVLVFILFNLNFVTGNVIHKSVNPMIKQADPKNIIPVSKEDILIENRGDPVKVMDDFPIPQTTSDSKSLSTNYPEDLSIIMRGAILTNSDIIQEKRQDIPNNEESHFPHYYLKDNLSGSTIGTTEYKFAEVDNSKSSYAWSDKNVSQYPGYYTSHLKDEITNVGAFFDVNNNFVDTTKPRSDANVGDVCYQSKSGEKICVDNSRQYNIPPSLVGNKQNCGFLNSIGLLEFSNVIKEDKERVINGGFLYDSVKGSKQHNEEYSKPLKPEVLKCHV